MPERNRRKQHYNVRRSSGAVIHSIHRGNWNRIAAQLWPPPLWSYPRICFFWANRTICDCRRTRNARAAKWASSSHAYRPFQWGSRPRTSHGELCSLIVWFLFAPILAIYQAISTIPMYTFDKRSGVEFGEFLFCYWCRQCLPPRPGLYHEWNARYLVDSYDLKIQVFVTGRRDSLGGCVSFREFDNWKRCSLAATLFVRCIIVTKSQNVETVYTHA